MSTNISNNDDGGRPTLIKLNNLYRFILPNSGNI